MVKENEKIKDNEIIILEDNTIFKIERNFSNDKTQTLNNILLMLFEKQIKVEYGGYLERKNYL